MNRPARTPAAFSKISVKSQTVLPRAVRDQLRLKPGDTLRYRLTDAGVLIDKAPAAEGDDPFAIFSEWSGEADAKAFDKL
jgi:antitoxin PrlF